MANNRGREVAIAPLLRGKNANSCIQNTCHLKLQKENIRCSMSSARAHIHYQTPPTHIPAPPRVLTSK